MRKIGPKWGFNSNQGLHAGRRCWRWHRNNSTWNKKFHAESCQNPNGSICKSPLDVWIPVNGILFVLHYKITWQNHGFTIFSFLQYLQYLCRLRYKDITILGKACVYGLCDVCEWFTACAIGLRPVWEVYGSSEWFTACVTCVSGLRPVWVVYGLCEWFTVCMSVFKAELHAAYNAVRKEDRGEAACCFWHQSKIWHGKDEEGLEPC